MRLGGISTGIASTPVLTEEHSEGGGGSDSLVHIRYILTEINERGRRNEKFSWYFQQRHLLGEYAQ